MLVRVLKTVFFPTGKSGSKGDESFLGKQKAMQSTDFADAYRHYEAGDFNAACRLLETLLSRQADHLDALCLLGDIEARKQRFDSSLAHYRKALLIDPTFVPALTGLGITLHDIGNFDEAYSYLEHARRLDPKNANVLNHLGLVLLKLGNLALAYQRISQSVQCAPNDSHAWNNFGVIQRRIGQIKQALVSFRKAVELNPQFSLALMNYGLALRDNEQEEEAETLLRKAVEMRPNNSTAHLNLASLLQEAGRLEEALFHLDKAIQLNPKSVKVHASLGTLYKKKGQPERSRACFLHALMLESSNAEALTGLAELQLSLSEFDKGWDNYEARFDGWDSPRQVFPYSEWNGESLDGKNILIYSEQGIGDILLFASCLPDVIERAKHCVIECYPRLIPLFARSFPNATVRSNVRQAPPDSDTIDPSLDYYSAIGSLPRFFRRTPEAFPNHDGYIKACPARMAIWRQRLTEIGPGLKVGISWRGGLARTGKVMRSIPLTEWLPLLELSEITWVNLQHDSTVEEIDAFTAATGIRIHHWDEALSDLDETAALIGSLDLVVSVCCTVVHMAGALGQPVWVLVPSAPSWRYLAAGERLPWYPNAHLFRQQQSGTWIPEFKELRFALNNRLLQTR